MISLQHLRQSLPKKKNKDNKQIKKLVELYGSKEMKAYIKKHYDGVYNPVDNPFDLTEEAVKQ